MSGQEQQCPTCGRTFKQLSLHKCKGPAGGTRASQESSPEHRSVDRQVCPTCGRTFKQLWRHKCKEHGPSSAPASASEAGMTSSKTVPDDHSWRKEQMCPMCGKTFKQLSRHKCKRYDPASPRPANVDGFQSLMKPSPDHSDTEEMCRTCGKTFKQLWRHKCKGPPVPNSPRPATVDGFQSFMKPSPDHSDTEEMCRTCGKTFKQLWRHKCKGPTVPNSPRPATVDGFQSLMKPSPDHSDTEEMCRTCGKTFKQLWRHKCKGPVPDSPDQSDTMQTCPTCGQMYKQLCLHKCKGPVSSPVGPSVVVEGRQSSSDSSNSGTQICRTCGQTFKQISRHKCKGAPPSPSPWPSGSGSPDRGLKEEGEVCRSGGQTFKQISRHRCKAAGAHNGARPKVKQEPSGDGSAPKAAGNSTGDGTTASTGEQPCPTCGVTFKRLWQHKCKYTSDADTLSGPAPPRAGRGRAGLNLPEPLQDAHGYIQTLDVAALEAEADTVMEALGIEPAAKPNQEAADFFAAEVTVKREEKEAVTCAVNPFRDRIVKRLDELTKCKWDCLNSGSSYDGTKVTRADEVDYMFFPCLPPDWLHVKLKGAPPGFCFVELDLASIQAVSSDQALPLEELKLLCHNRHVSSAAFRDKVFNVFSASVNEERRAEVDPEGKPGSPSFPVLLKAIPRTYGKAGLTPVSIDLVPAIHIAGLPPGVHKNLKKIRTEDAEFIKKAGFEVVPKEYQGDGYRDVRHLLWRLSFSRAEKQLTQFADKRPEGPDGKLAPVTCRKNVLRLLKRILEIIKGLDNSREKQPNPKLMELQRAAKHLKAVRGRREEIEKFTTFQVRTLMWTLFYLISPGNEKWVTSNFRTRLAEALKKMRKMVSGRMHVSHFFLPDMDIMADVPRHEREFLYIMFYIAGEIF